MTSPQDRWLVIVGSALALGVLGYGVAASASQAPAVVVVVVPAPLPTLATVPPAATSAVPPGAPLKSPTPAPAAPAGNGPAEMDWSTLTAYEYQQGLAGLSDAVKALDGRRVSMGGFLMPIYEFDDIHEFSLVPNHQSCCFGIPAGLNGQIYVKITGKRGLPNTNEPLRVTGTFRAKEIKEAGYVLAIYAIEDADVKIVGY